MNRRKFLSLLGIGTAVVAVAPTALSMMESADVATPAAYSTYIVGKDAVISTYMEYANFSDFAISAAIDDVVKKSAEELAYNFGLRVDELVRA